MQVMEMEVQCVLVFPREAAAREVARELADGGCRLVTVHAGVGESWWDVSSLAVYPIPEDRQEHLKPLLQHESRRLSAVARSRGGALVTHVSGLTGSAFSRNGLVHEDATAHMELPDPMPRPRPLPPAAPQWEGLHFGDPEVEIREAVAIAKRMYGTHGAAPQLIEFLLDDASPEQIAEPDESTREFLADLVQMAHHMPTRDAGAVLIIPYLAELARSQVLSPGARTSLLHVLLGFASRLDDVTADFADWSAMGGGVELQYVTRLRDAVVGQIPSLVPLWDREPPAGRFVLAALATFCPAQTAPLVLPRLADIPAPQGTDRSDALALAAALLDEDTNAMNMALRQIATWDIALATQLDSPHTPRPQAARAALASCVGRELPNAMHLSW
jgi:hypothetical protein